MDLFIKLFGGLLTFVYHCFDRIVIHGYLTGLSRPEHVVHFFREIVGVPVITKETLRQRTTDYQSWVEAFARNRQIPIQWPEKGIRREDYVLRWLRRVERKNAYGVYFIFKSMEVGSTFRITVPKLRRRLSPQPTPLRSAKTQGARAARTRRHPLRLPPHPEGCSGRIAVPILP
jgi:hypothetical protein